ncbi:MAG: AEC family transporter [Candidatus Odinarchaeota archaeon]|nr:AEC family transporter [Candidatus Thorarchaeota archaeon]
MVHYRDCWVCALQTIFDTAAQFGLFYGLIVLGYVIAKVSGRGKVINKHLTFILIYLLIPLLFIYTLLTASPDTLLDIPLIVALVLLVLLLGPAFMYIRLWKRDIDDSTKGVFYLCVTFNNALFIPLPLVLMFIGSAGIPIIIIFSLTQMILLATLGSFMGAIYGSKTSQLSRIAKDALTFPPFIAAIIALVLFTAQVRLTGDLASVFSFAGPLTTYLALISVGVSIGVRFSLIDIRAALEVVGIRQLLVPLITIPIIILSGLSHVTTSIIILEALMPPAVLTVVYATSFELDAEKAATIVTVGTLFLLPIIPFVSILLG